MSQVTQQTKKARVKNLKQLNRKNRVRAQEMKIWVMASSPKPSSRHVASLRAGYTRHLRSLASFKLTCFTNDTTDLIS